MAPNLTDKTTTLIAAAHHQPHAPIILCRDNLNTHLSAAMRTFIDAHRDWLTVVRLPAYAPDLNPVEGIRAHVKRDPGNLVAGGIDQLAATVKTLLKRVQYRPELIDGFPAQTGLVLDCHDHTDPGPSRSVGRLKLMPIDVN